MKKSNQSLNKMIAKKDLINSISSLSAFLIVVFGIMMFLLVLYPQQDDPALGVGEGGISFPDALGQASGGLFCLDLVALPVLFDSGQVDHGSLLTPSKGSS